MWGRNRATPILNLALQGGDWLGSRFGLFTHRKLKPLPFDHHFSKEGKLLCNCCSVVFRFDTMQFDGWTADALPNTLSPFSALLLRVTARKKRI
jgi:hypothetical protein